MHYFTCMRAMYLANPSLVDQSPMDAEFRSIILDQNLSEAEFQRRLERYPKALPTDRDGAARSAEPCCGLLGMKPSAMEWLQRTATRQGDKLSENELLSLIRSASAARVSRANTGAALVRRP